MPKRHTKYYLYCQFVGWGLLLGLLCLVNSATLKKDMILVVACLISTHLLREVIITYKWISLPFRKAGIRIFPTVILACLLSGLIYEAGCILLLDRTPLLYTVIALIPQFGFLILPWSMIYCFYHYVNDEQRKRLERERLEGKIKEIKTGAIGTDIDQLIASLDRIRSLIDENPVRARTEITAFSRFLREGHLNP